MCDYSLEALRSRKARVGDTLISSSFPGTPTRGFTAKGEPGVAVCLMPGTEVAFDSSVVFKRRDSRVRTVPEKMARFRKINESTAHAHHDALEFPDGTTVLLSELDDGQGATVLQLPADPTTKAEQSGEATREIETID